MAAPNFSGRYIGFDTWIINGDGCDCYLLIGEDEAIMIDAGMSKHNIRAYAQTLTDLPVKRVINTHSHFDHTGGNGYFEQIYGTEGIARSAKNTFGSNPNDYPLDYEFTIVKDNDIIDFRGRTLRIIELDSHSPGDIVILDETKRLLFCGDEIECRSSLLLPGYAEERGQIHAAPAAAVETHLNAMKKIKQFYDRFDFLCPAHNGSPMDKIYVDWYISLDEKIMSGEIRGNKEVESLSYGPHLNHFPYPDAGYLRAGYKGASLVYNENLIFEKDREKTDALPPATPLHIIASYYIFS